MLTENIVGNPGETYEMVLETLRLNQKIKPLYANTSLFTPYPKLPATEFAIENNYFDGNFYKIDANYFSDTLIKFNNEKEKNRILNWRSLFSSLARYPVFEKIFLCLFVNVKHNNVMRTFGKIFDGYYAYKCILYKLTLKEFFDMAKNYLVMPR
ncbi:MAG TPA: hypothetical protein QF468_04400 [Nitrospinota bacterium]|jgi:radical SAM superfamily enzyme YgiQ (UPF0313 family)|nr:hypothetical protein [Nitrospinota bacterium]